MNGLHAELKSFWDEVQALVLGMNGETYTSDDVIVSRARSKLVILHRKYYDNRLFDKVPVPKIQVIDRVLRVSYSPKAIVVALGDWTASATYEPYWKELTGQ